MEELLTLARESVDEQDSGFCEWFEQRLVSEDIGDRDMYHVAVIPALTRRHSRIVQDWEKKEDYPILPEDRKRERMYGGGQPPRVFTPEQLVALMHWFYETKFLVRKEIVS